MTRTSRGTVSRRWWSPALGWLAIGSSAALAQPPASLTVPEYHLMAQVDPASPRLTVSGTMRVRIPASPGAIPTLTLSGVMHDVQLEIVEPRDLAARLVPVAAADSSQWTARLPTVLPAARELVVHFRCSTDRRDAFLYHLGSDVSFVGAQGVPWYPTLAGMDSRGTGTMHIDVPSQYTVVGSGESDPSHTTFRLVSAGIFSFAVGKYQVVRDSETTSLAAYVLSSRSHTTDYVRHGVRVLDLLTKEFGPYPYGSFSIVEVPHEIAEKAGFEGASFTGFILVDGTDLDSDFNLAFYGHEISHQWWGNLITLTGARGNDMLDEAMAQFGALYVIGSVEGEDAADAFRRSGYPGTNWHQNGQGYFDFAAAGLDHSLGDLPGGSLSHELADAKGFLVLDLLARTVGFDRFRATLHEITGSYGGRGITWDAFLHDVQAQAGVDLSWFYDQWFNRTGAPSWTITWKQVGRTVRGTIRQEAPFYRATLDLTVTGPRCLRETHAVTVVGAETTFQFAVDGTVDSLELDPHFHVPHWTSAYRAEASAIAPALHAEMTFWSGQLDSANAECQRALMAVASPDLYGERFLLEWILGQIAMQQHQWPMARRHFEAALASPSRRPYSQMWVYIELATVGKQLHDRALLELALTGAITTDALAPRRTGKVAAVRALVEGM